MIIFIFWYFQTDNGALIVLKNDIVYAIGNNMYNRLAIAQENNTFENIKSPTKVEILCEKNIKKFAIGVYMFALTKTGQVLCQKIICAQWKL